MPWTLPDTWNKLMSKTDKICSQEACILMGSKIIKGSKSTVFLSAIEKTKGLKTWEEASNVDIEEKCFSGRGIGKWEVPKRGKSTPGVWATVTCSVWWNESDCEDL